MDAEEKKVKKATEKKVVKQEDNTTTINEQRMEEIVGKPVAPKKEPDALGVVAQWNKDHPIGTKVLYHGIRSVTRREAFSKDGQVLVVIKASGYAIPVEKLTFPE